MSKAMSAKGTLRKDGYVQVCVTGGVRMQHLLIVEKVLGKPLPEGAEVHHVNEIRHDNRHENLVVCPSKGYHKLLHQRMRALAACGDANKRVCKYCKQYDHTYNLVERHNNGSFHKSCRDQYNAAYRERILIAKKQVSHRLERT